MLNIYVVEDEDNIRELVLYALKSSDYHAEGFESAADLWRRLESGLPQLILLDIMLPGEDGLATLKKLRAKAKTKDIPVIMLTAKSSEFDRVSGLDAGADDYITKPFSVLELISRIKAVTRRMGKKEQLIVIGNITVDTGKHTVSAGDMEIKLTYKEFELLYYLMLNAGLVMSREKLLTEIWGYEYEGESRTVDMHIKTLRQKLGDSGQLIRTIRGLGYKMGD